MGALLLALVLSDPASAQIAAGDIGGTCLPGRTCNDGACAAGGLCAPCGMPGQVACPNPDPDKPADCHLSGWGYVPVATASGTICINPKAEDCGHVGEPACDRDGRNGCYYGVPVASRQGELCLACGAIGQACCTGTDRVCDTGSCQSGICRLGPADAAKAIKEAIIACRFDEARQRLAALPAGNPDKDTLGRWLDDALSVERTVANMVSRAENALKTARQRMAKGDVTGAYTSYRMAQRDYEQARDLTRCKDTADRLDVEAMKSLIATDEAFEAMLVDWFASALAKCDFDQAAKMTEAAETNGLDQAARMRQRYDEARSAERQAREAYARGQAENARGNKLMAAKRYDDAVKAYGAARTQLERARQRTVCKVTRDAIASAIFDVGANEEIAVAAADVGKGPPSPPPSKGIDPTPAGTHPCLDHAIKADHGMADYRLGLGGGGTTYYLKGPYICAQRYDGASFEVFDGGIDTIYGCDRDGDRYVNCKVLHVNHIAETYAVKDGIDYHYACGNEGKCWMHVFPVRRD